MTDTVRCTFDSTNTFTCEVELGPDPAPGTASNQASSPPAAAPAPDPAVAMLITSYKTYELPAPNVPLVTSQALEQCASAELGMGLAFATPGTLGMLSGFKAGLDESECLRREQNEAAIPLAQQDAAADCAARGGVVTGVDGRTTYCEVQRDVR